MVVGVVLFPIVWVWMLQMFDQSFARLQTRVEDASAEAIRTGDFDAVALRYAVRIRLVSPDDTILYDIDRVSLRPWYQFVKDPFYGSEGPPDPRVFDQELALPLPQRSEVLDARAFQAQRSACQLSRDDRLVGCSTASLLDDGRLLYVQAYADRLLRSLSDDRGPITAMLIVVLIFAIAAALWLGWRVVAPLEYLRNQVVSRTEGSVSTEPILIHRNDEIGDLANAFNQLLAALDERNKANEIFAADLAHELKNPVAALRAAAEAMESDRPIEGSRRERLQRVLSEASQRMDKAISAFLDLARAEAGLLHAKREVIELGELVRGIVTSTEADPRNTHLCFEVRGESVPMTAASERLETALRNLVGNAASYARSEVILTLAHTPEAITISVADDGPGIPADELDQVFDRYFSKREGGTGLGLALTRAIVEAHGGQLTATNDQGALFEIRLPR